MSETLFISLLYTTYKLLLEQNLIVALHFLDNYVKSNLFFKEIYYCLTTVVYSEKSHIRVSNLCKSLQTTLNHFKPL